MMAASGILCIWLSRIAPFFRDRGGVLDWINGNFRLGHTTCRKVVVVVAVVAVVGTSRR